MDKKTQKALIITVYVVLGLLLAILAFAFIGAHYKLPLAVSIWEWIKGNYHSLVSGSAITALLAGVRILMVIKAKNELSLQDILVIKDDVLKTNNGVAETEQKLHSTTEQLQERLGLLSVFESKIASLQEAIAVLEKKSNIVIDLLLIYVMKNKPDQTVNELRLAYEESELLKNIKVLQDIKEENEATTKQEAKEAKELLQTAATVIKSAKKRYAASGERKRL